MPRIKPLWRALLAAIRAATTRAIDPWRDTQPSDEPLRCQPGDLCMVTADLADTIAGATFTVLQRDAIVRIGDHNGTYWVLCPPRRYSVDSHCGRYTQEGELLGIADQQLRPLRATNGVDQTLRVAGAPPNQAVVQNGK